MKYFIMAWDDDSEPIKYHDFYFVANKENHIMLFSSLKDAESFGRSACKYFKIGSWHNYMVGNNSLNIKKLIL